MHGMLRLAGWGVAATAALLAVVIAANSGVGRERLSDALAEIKGTRAAEAASAQADQAAQQATQLARMTAMENDAKRLREMVRSLAGDRERLMARIDVLERGLDDVTGAIQRQQAVTPPPATPVTQVPAEPPTKPVVAPPQIVAPATPAPTPEPPKRVASVAPPAGMPELEALQPRAAGVDIGGASNFDGLRTLWNAMTASHPELFDGLQPIVSVRENGKSRGPDLRLIAGPLSEVESANRICIALAAAKRSCRLVQFEGQPLSLHAPEAPRRPATTRPRPTAVRAAP